MRKKIKLSEETKRKIRETKVIHHINGNHKDNKPENLLLMTQSEHINLHRKQGDLKRR